MQLVVVDTILFEIQVVVPEAEALVPGEAPPDVEADVVLAVVE
jgi:hypothetical protein